MRLRLRDHELGALLLPDHKLGSFMAVLSIIDDKIRAAAWIALNYWFDVGAFKACRTGVWLSPPEPPAASPHRAQAFGHGI
jgi:hypothetical protein